MQHFIEKWDSYLGKLFGILVAAIAVIKPESPSILQYFSYFAFVMIGIAVFDIAANWTQHESKFWHLMAVLSNLIMIASSLIILHNMAGFALPIAIPEFWLFTVPNFFLYLGIFLFVENSLWSWVYDHT